MKNTLLFLMLLLSGMAGAQIVNIPDPAFKNALVTGYDITAKNNAGGIITVDANGDGEIQLSEALIVWDMTISDSNILNIEGIEAFTNLRKLSLFTLDNINILNFTALSNLQDLSIDSFNGDQVNIVGLSNLKSLTIEDAYDLEVLNVTGLSSLTDLQLSNTNVNIDMTQLPTLERISLDDSGQRIANFSNQADLEYLAMDHSYSLKVIVLGNKPLLTYLRIDNDNAYNDTPSIDISGCTALTYLSILFDTSSMQQATRFLNLKNGVTVYEHFFVEVNANDISPIYICVEDNMESQVIMQPNTEPYVQISTYCSFVPGGNYNIVAGTISFDADNNGCDGDDNYTDFVRLDLNNGIESLSTFAISGQYHCYPREGSYTIIPQLENDWFTVTPPSVAIDIATADGSSTTQNFCISANGIHPDVEVVAVSGEPRPGFDSFYRIIYKNKGNQTLSGTVTLNYDDSVLDYVSAYPVEAASGTGSLTWDYIDFLPFESRFVDVFLNLNGPMETPAVNIGDVLAFSASVTPVAGDETPADNTFAISQTVVGSFDPNDITCLEGRSVSPDKIGEYLHYNINFENTGTAPATFIVVKDMIDETKFDINTLQLMDASHAIETRINGNKVEFIFDNINLGPEEKGNVTFKIKTLNSLQVNDDVTQQADIFFDYNWPIQTNEATTTFEVLSRGDFALDNSVTIYPNPAKNIVTISADSNVKSIQLYDIQGRLLQSGTVNDIDTTIDLSSRAAGIYFIKAVTEKGIWVGKIVKQ